MADEAHALKNRSSIRTRKLRKLGQSCENRILLTGVRVGGDLVLAAALVHPCAHAAMRCGAHAPLCADLALAMIPPRP